VKNKGRIRRKEERVKQDPGRREGTRLRNEEKNY